jgi:hypothetical protein
MATFPNDQFDDLPDNLDRVGAHRGPKVRGRGWIGFGWAVLATAILIVAGLFVLQSLVGTDGILGSGAEPTDSPTASATPVIVPVTDPTTIKARHITITILNGTPTVALQTSARSRLVAAHWNVTSTAPASATNIAKTVVYYSKAANQDVALGIAKALGTSTVRLTDVFPGTPITVVIGSDYKG